MIRDTRFLAHWRALSSALLARGRKPATPAQATRCFRAGLSAGDGAAILATEG